MIKKIFIAAIAFVSVGFVSGIAAAEDGASAAASQSGSCASGFQIDYANFPDGTTAQLKRDGDVLFNGPLSGSGSLSVPNPDPGHEHVIHFPFIVPGSDNVADYTGFIPVCPSEINHPADPVPSDATVGRSGNPITYPADFTELTIVQEPSATARSVKAMGPYNNLKTSSNSRCVKVYGKTKMYVPTVVKGKTKMVLQRVWWCK